VLPHNKSVETVDVLVNANTHVAPPLPILLFFPRFPASPKKSVASSHAAGFINAPPTTTIPPKDETTTRNTGIDTSTRNSGVVEQPDPNGVIIQGELHKQ
jgi:hypothetical protein